MLFKIFICHMFSVTQENIPAGYSYISKNIFVHEMFYFFKSNDFFCFKSML